MKTPRVISRSQQRALLLRKTRWAFAVYFATGVLPPLPTIGYRLQTSSATITPNTLFSSHQTHHR